MKSKTATKVALIACLCELLIPSSSRLTRDTFTQGSGVPNSCTALVTLAAVVASYA